MFDEGLADCNEALRLDPNNVLALHNRAAFWLQRGELDKAIADCDEAIHFDPKCIHALVNRGTARGEKGMHASAIEDFAQCLRLEPCFVPALIARANIRFKSGEFDEALADSNRALRIEPKNVDALWVRAGVWLNKSEWGSSIADYTRIIEENTQAAYALRFRALVLAICPDAKYRNEKQAVEDAKRACELNNWKSSNYLGTLAAAYAATGQFDEARKWQKKALEDPAYSKQVGDKGQKILQKYENKQPLQWKDWAE